MFEERMSCTDKISMGLNRGIPEEVWPKTNMKLELFDEFGNLKETREVHNTVTTAGKNGVAAQCASSPGLAKAGWMEVGTGSPTATLLGAYISGSRTACSSYTTTNNVVTYVCTFGAGVGTGAITEAGTFNVVTQNTVDMWMSASFAVINKLAADSLVITWTLTVN